MTNVTVQIDRYPCACKGKRVIRVNPQHPCTPYWSGGGVLEMQGFKSIYGVPDKPMAEVTIECSRCELYATQTVEVNIITPD